MTSKTKRVLDVGQCDFDHSSIRRLLSEEFGAEVVRANDAEEAVCAVREGGYDLVLVNRTFDADGYSGLDLIRRLQSDEHTRTSTVVLVSNHANAQDAAVALGAERGFGKDALTSPETRTRLSSLLGLTQGTEPG